MTGFYKILFFTLPFLFYGQSVLCQYFGKNKVQYDKFEFEILNTAHFQIHYYPLIKETIPHIGVLAEEWYQRYSKLLRHSFSTRKPLIIYADHPDFQQTEIISELIDVGVQGVTEGLKTRLVMPLAVSYANTNHVLGHEMAHVFQYDILLDNDSLSLESIYNIPLWMIEGLAEYLSIGSENELTAMWMRDAVIHDRIPTIDDINKNLAYSPYRYGHALWTYITGVWGDRIIPEMFNKCAVFGFNHGLYNTLGISSDSLTVLWQNSLREDYLPMISKKNKAEDIGEKLVSFDKGAGEFNLAPVISPNGKYIIFLSEKDLFTVDLFLADAKTGKIIRKLGSSSAGKYYDALNFIQSSGCWSPDSKKIAFTAVSKGTNEIVIVDIKSGKVKEHYSFSGLSAIYDLAWSPDGNQLAVSGSNGGMTDLYLYDFKHETLRQLTNDHFSDLQPTWSPDGKTIAFVTDRNGSEDFKQSVLSKMKIAFFQVDDETISSGPEFKNAKAINPIYSFDGNSIYFIANPNGISNVFQYEIKSGKSYQLTNLATGISGLTDLSPALSISGKNKRLIFSTFEKSGYNIYGTETENLSRTNYEEIHDTLNAALIPPIKRTKKDIVNKYLTTFESDSIIEYTFRYTPYLPRIRLANIGDVYAGVATGGYGSSFIGGVSLTFTDLLNQHNLYTTLRANGTIKDIAGQVVYLNKVNRFQWGASISHIPYASSLTSISSDSITTNGNTTPVYIVDQIIYRTYEENFSLLGKYPISQSNRLDFGLGYSYINFSKELFRSTTRTDFSLIERERIKLDAPASFSLVNFTTAFVGDKSFHGFTAPLKGLRYRFEAQINTGTYNFASFLMDYRYYLRLKPFSLAFRGMHLGRYFGDSENDILSPIYLGSEYFIRGYSIFSFDPDECSETVNGNCAEFERLIGSKIIVGNLELRLPLTGYRRLALIKSRMFFTSLNAFFEGGVAWWEDDPPVFKWSTTSKERIPVFSAGMSIRINLLGAIVMEIYGAYPFQRPQKNFTFGFAILQGW